LLFKLSILLLSRLYEVSMYSIYTYLKDT
jgi:hypothetical protein